MSSPTPHPTCRLACAAFVALWGAGCAGKSTDTADTVSSGTDAEQDCGGPVDAIAPGLRLPCDGGGCTLEVVDTDPAPPDRGDNTWTLRVLDGAGADDVGADGITVAPFMPAHDHGTVPADYAGVSDGEDGWTVGPFDLFMPGRWELRATVNLTEDSIDTAVFAFCVEG